MLLFIDLEDDFKTKLKKIDGDITLASVRDITESSRKYPAPAGILTQKASHKVRQRIMLK